MSFGLHFLAVTNPGQMAENKTHQTLVRKDNRTKAAAATSTKNETQKEETTVGQEEQEGEREKDRH